tara:strand:- start:1842 stop:2294 length:453 start_codon:yes stop_codon:yes gene_type:complete
MKIISRLTFSLIIFLNINIVLAENNKKVSVTNLWIKEAPPTVSVLVAYAKLKNNTDTSLSLTSIESPFFSSIEIHRSIIKNDTASMERHTTLEIPSKATVELAPGDFHLMLFNPKKPLKIDDAPTLIFGFSDGTQITVRAPIKKRNNTSH